MKAITLISMLFYLSPFAIEKSPETVADQAQDDKELLYEYYKQTYEGLEDMVEDLNEDQLQYTMAENTWSVGEILEHIILTEKALFQMAKSNISKPENPERKGEIIASDEQLLSGIEDRSTRVKTSPELEPRGRYDAPEEALDDLQELREEILDYVEETSVESMRNHILDTPMGPVDGYQAMLFIAGHTSRHTAQVAEVMADAGFPQ